MTAALEVTCKNLGRTSSLAASGIWGCQAFTGTFQAFIIVFVWTSKSAFRETQQYWKTAPSLHFLKPFKQKLLLFMADACVLTHYHRIFCIFPVADLHQGSQQLKKAPLPVACPGTLPKMTSVVIAQWALDGEAQGYPLKSELASLCSQCAFP